MQGIRKKIKDIKGKIKKLFKTKKAVIIIIAILLLASCIITFTTQIIKQIQIKQLENRPLIEYEIKRKKDSKIYEILVKVNSVDGIESIKYINQYTNKEVQLNTNGKLTVGIDYLAKDQTNYEFKIKIKGKAETTENLYFEIPRIQGKYTLDDGIYVNEPDLTGYNSDYTRYINISKDGKLQPSNWISGEEPANWYNYKNSEWANIYVETNGMETYYVWIPRYCFKLDQENERSEIKFIDVYDNYKDENGNITTWEELEEQGYQIPEAFEYNNVIMPGYWAMKYTAGDVITPSTINYDMSVYRGTITLRNIKLNTTITNTNPIVKYTIALNGEIVKTIEDGESISNINAQIIEFSNMIKGENTVNITGLNVNGEIVGSMTKLYSPAKVNEPDLSKFNPDTTFYVTYDEEEDEHSTIPITEQEPEDWYEYGESRWANIVTRNNGLETYYTWIPRYEFTLDQINERSTVKFISGTSTETTEGYQIPEAFTFNGVELTGYWAMKYTAGDEAAPTFDTEVVATSSTIRTKGITGTKVAEGQEYYYYINGEYKDKKTNSADTFEFTGLSSNTKYTILVEIRDSSTDAHLGAVVKQISTIDANKPDLTNFNTKETDSEGNKLPITYYVVYEGENISKYVPITEAEPDNWYDYSQSKWANIVVTDGTINGATIENATATTYLVWIPRYEFMLTSSQQKQPAQARSEVRFVTTDITNENCTPGYQVPEAFTFNGVELTGYWAMKYTAGG